MSVNTMNFEQASAVLNSLASQALGDSALAATDLSSYISVGQATLRVGYDPLAIGISQMVGRTIFAYRPYSSPLSILRRDESEYGAITRKVNALYQQFVNDPTYSLVDDQSIDQYTVRKPKLWQSNFYGFDVWRDVVSVTRQQLKNAVTSPEDMGRLMDLVLGTKANEMEHGRETFERATLANLIGAIVAINNSNQRVRLLTLYNAETGKSLTATTVRDPDNYGDFVKFAYAKIAMVSDMLRNYSSIYHLNPTAGSIMRHTEKADQRIFVYTANLHDIDARVYADTFNASMVSEQVPYTQAMDFFQSITTPDSINITPAYIDNTGAIATGEAQRVDNIFALICDRDALGVNYHDQSVDVTPFNAAGKYYNYHYHEARRYWNDVTENAVLFTLD